MPYINGKRRPEDPSKVSSIGKKISGPTYSVSDSGGIGKKISGPIYANTNTGPNEGAGMVQQPVKSTQQQAQEVASTQPAPKPPTPEQPNPVVMETTPQNQASPWLGDPSQVNETSEGPATRENPVVTRTPAPQPKTQGMQDFSDMQGMSSDQLQDYIDLAQVRAMNGEKLTTQEQARLMKAGRMLQQQQQAASVENPYPDMIDDAETRREAERERLRQEREKLIAEEEDLAMRDFEKRAERQREMGEDLKDASQQSLSFSGFGRSTFAADQATKIQKQVNRNIDTLDAERAARVNRFRAAQRGADEEQLKAMDEVIQNLENKNAEYSMAIAQQMNEFNQMNTANYQDKIQNIFELSQQMTDDSPLTEDEQMLVDSYANLIIDNEGNVDTSLLETIPARLRGPVMNAGAIVKGGLPGDQEVDAGETVSTDDGTFQWNPDTGRYDIPVGGATTSGGLNLGDIMQQDFSGVADQFPGEAWAKNNNPSGITRHAASDGLKKAWEEAGVSFNKGTSRPSNEGGNYVKFATMGDGMEAKKIAIKRGNQNIYERLQQWVGNPGSDTAKQYAMSIMSDAGIGGDTNIKFSDLQEDQMDDLMMAQIKRESPGLYQVLESGAGAVIKYKPEREEIYKKYLSGDMTTKDWDVVGDEDQFMKEAMAYKQENNTEVAPSVENATIIADVNDLFDMGSRTKRASRTDIGVETGGSAAQFNAIHNFIADNMTLDSFIEAKEQGATFGAMSEGEWEILKNSATKLDRRMSNKDYRAELVSIKSVMNGLPKDKVRNNKKKFLEIRENEGQDVATEWAKNLGVMDKIGNNDISEPQTIGGTATNDPLGLGL